MTHLSIKVWNQLLMEYNFKMWDLNLKNFGYDMSNLSNNNKIKKNKTNWYLSWPQFQ